LRNIDLGITLDLFNAGRYEQLIHELQSNSDEINHPGILALLALSHQKLGSTSIAIEILNSAILKFRDSCFLFNTLGSIHEASGDLVESEQLYRKALAISPSTAEYYSNLAAIKYKLGTISESKELLLKAIELRPDLSGAFNNLGNIYRAEVDYETALSFYYKSIDIDKNREAFDNCSDLLIELHRPLDLISLHKRHATLANRPSAKAVFAQAIGLVRQEKYNPAWYVVSINLLNDSDISAENVLHLAYDILKRDENFQTLRNLLEDFKPESLVVYEWLNGLTDECRDLIYLALSSGVISDFELEKVFTELRRQLLYTLIQTRQNLESKNKLGAYITKLCWAFAMQSHLNEYIFEESQQEKARVSELEDALINVSNGCNQVPLSFIYIFFSYRNYRQQYSNLFSAIYETTNEYTLFKKLVVTNFNEELALCVTIPRLTSIENTISERVRSHYEINPYPAWSKKRRATGTSLNEFLSTKFAGSPYRIIKKTLDVDILIAGCGTGKVIASTCNCIKTSRKVLAIDLSLKSLAYAKRQLLAEGYQNIELGQADILELETLNRTFDFIDASGVLHHLDDPTEGWKILIALLNPGGVMRVGLYSDRARAPITQFKKNFSSMRNLSCSVNASEIESLRSIRNVAKEFPEFSATWILKTKDFFYSSGFRDLILHEQEMTFSIMMIKRLLSEYDLNFIGFDLPKGIELKFLSEFKDRSKLFNLAYWDLFEETNPDVFSGMYQFYVQKS
jgi:SAM-dependent methyltransferase/Tfp pilus assembly protein PilF